MWCVYQKLNEDFLSNQITYYGIVYYDVCDLFHRITQFKRNLIYTTYDRLSRFTHHLFKLKFKKYVLNK